MQDMQKAPRSERFDDVYFSAEGGLAETRHVFLNGNGLPGRWQGRRAFTICETGFGTGLNFLAAWALFERTAEAGQTLHFISFEKYPLMTEEIRAMLTPLQPSTPLPASPLIRGEGLPAISPPPLQGGGSRRGVETPEIKDSLDEMLALYPENPEGVHRIQLNDAVTLTLIFDDVNAAIPAMTETVDAWFLDGFSPAKNPDMWTDVLFENMARLSAPGATLATFTAAGAVRRGLERAGFHVEKRPGFGHKRHMTIGRKA